MSTTGDPVVRKGQAPRERILAAARDLAIASGGQIEIVAR